MARYKVLRQLEHNRKLYVPATAHSAADGSLIEVDASGTVELREEEAAQLTHGQIQPFAETSAPGDDTGRSSSKKLKTPTPAAGGQEHE